MATRRGYRRFTPEEDAALLEHAVADPADRTPLRELAAHFNREPKALRSRLYKLRSRKPEPETRRPTGERPCARCGTMFERTAKRWMLCAHCFAHADD